MAWGYGTGLVGSCSKQRREDKDELGGYLVPVKGKVKAQPAGGGTCDDPCLYPPWCLSCDWRANSHADKAKSDSLLQSRKIH